MTGRSHQRMALLAALLCLGVSARVRAQVPTSGYQAQQSLASAAYGSATVTPGMPFLNPYLMPLGQANPDYITYMYLQNQRNGGIGSGVISGTRPAPGATAGATRLARTAPSAVDASTPLGAKASPYPSRPPVELNRVALPMIADAPTANTGASFMRGPGRTRGRTVISTGRSPRGTTRDDEACGEYAPGSRLVKPICLMSDDGPVPVRGRRRVAVTEGPTIGHDDQVTSHHNRQGVGRTGRGSPGRSVAWIAQRSSFAGSAWR